MKHSNRIISYLTSVFMAFVMFIAFKNIGEMFNLGGAGLAFGYVIIIVNFLAMLGIIKMPAGVSMITTFYTPSDLVTAQAILTNRFADSAKKEINPVTFLAFRKVGTISDPDFKELRTREDRPLAGYFLNRTVRALGSGRSYNATGATGTSTAFVPSYITYNDTFSLSLKLPDDNVYTGPEMLANEYENVFKNFSIGNETNATNYLYNNRSTYNAAVANGTFNNVTNAFEISNSTYGTQGMQITKSMMWENKWQNYPLTVFCDTVSFNLFAYQAQQGGSNFQNLSFQFQGVTYVQSIYLTAKAIALGYTKGFWMAVPDETIAALDWIPKQNREGYQEAQYTWFNVLNPFDGITYAAYRWVIGTDSFTNSVPQDLQMNFQISLDIAFQNALLNVNAGETPIQAVAFV